MKGVQQGDNLAQRRPVCHRCSAVSTFGRKARCQAIVHLPIQYRPLGRIVTMVRLAFQCCSHLGHQVLDEEQFQLSSGIVDANRQVMGDVVAEGPHGTVVVWLDPLAHEVRKAVDIDGCTCLLGIGEKELLARFLAQAVFTRPKAALQRRLDRA